MDDTIDNDALGEFEDRHTLRYVRFYPVEVARAWQAATLSEQLNVWLYPVTKVEPKLGGRCSFSWGSPEDSSASGTVSRFEPPRLVRYELGAWNYIQIELSPVEGGTRFTFTQFFDEQFRHADDGQLDTPDGAQPAGPGTPWRAGFLAGFHVNFDYLGRFFAEDWSDERIARESERLVARANAAEPDDRRLAPANEWERLVPTYYDHILASCPRASQSDD